MEAVTSPPPTPKKDGGGGSVFVGPWRQDAGLPWLTCAKRVGGLGYRRERLEWS